MLTTTRQKYSTFPFSNAGRAPNQPIPSEISEGLELCVSALAYVEIALGCPDPRMLKNAIEFVRVCGDVLTHTHSALRNPNHHLMTEAIDAVGRGFMAADAIIMDSKEARWLKH